MTVKYTSTMALDDIGYTARCALHVHDPETLPDYADMRATLIEILDLIRETKKERESSDATDNYLANPLAMALVVAGATT